MDEKDYSFFITVDLSSYIGKWVAICDQKIISVGESAKDVLKKAKIKYPNKRPLITKVPEKDTMIF